MRTSLFLLCGFFFLAASLIIAKLFSAHLPGATAGHARAAAPVGGSRRDGDRGGRRRLRLLCDERSFRFRSTESPGSGEQVGRSHQGQERGALRAGEDGRAEGRIRKPAEEQG